MFGTTHIKIRTVVTSAVIGLLLLQVLVATSILTSWRVTSLVSSQFKDQPFQSSNDDALNKLRIENAKLVVEMDKLQYEMRVMHGIGKASKSDSAQCLRGIEWHWYPYSSLFAKNNPMRLLIAQYTGLEPDYVEMLTISEKANRAYARKWKHDYVQMKGVAFGSGKPGQAGANKVALLEKAIHENIYDAVLILDADAVIVDFDQDALDLIPNSMLLTATRVRGGPHSWNVNNGVTLWNVRHEKMIEVWTEWYHNIVKRMHKGRNPDDQAELHRVFKNYSEEEMKGIVNAVNKTHSDSSNVHVTYFGSSNGTFAKHVKRANNKMWISPKEDMAYRKSLLESYVDAVCSKWIGACDEV